MIIDAFVGVLTNKIILIIIEHRYTDATDVRGNKSADKY